MSVKTASFQQFIIDQQPKYDKLILEEFIGEACDGFKRPRRPVDPLRAAIRKARREAKKQIPVDNLS